MINLTATVAATTAVKAAAEREWFAAVEARNGYDERAARYLSTVTSPAGRAQVRRQQGAKRAHLTRRIIRAEKAIDAARSTAA